MVLALVIAAVFIVFMLLMTWDVMKGFGPEDDALDRRESSELPLQAGPALVMAPAPRPNDHRCVLCRAPIRRRATNTEEVVAEIEGAIEVDRRIVARTLSDPRPEAIQQLFVR